MSARLVRVELTRFRWRRAVLALLVLAIVVPALIAASRVWSTRPVSQNELDNAAQNASSEIQRCLKRPQQFGVRPAVAESRCEDMIVGWYTGRERLSLASERTGGSGMAVVAVLTAFLLLAGTTFVGHDWNTGSMSNQLLFEARRGRVWLAKGLAVTLAALVLSTVVSLGYWLALWATVKARDLPMLDDALTDSLAYGMRGALFATAAALGGFALTMLFRSTVATIGVLFGVSIAGGIILATLGVGEQWQPQKNVSAIVKNGTMYYADVPDSCFVGRQEMKEPEPNSECDQYRDLSLWHGVAYYGIALGVTAGASVASFRRRDVP